jgi:hypothetical protein
MRGCPCVVLPPVPRRQEWCRIIGRCGKESFLQFIHPVLQKLLDAGRDMGWALGRDPSRSAHNGHFQPVTPHNFRLTGKTGNALWDKRPIITAPSNGDCEDQFALTYTVTALNYTIEGESVTGGPLSTSAAGRGPCTPSDYPPERCCAALVWFLWQPGPWLDARFASLCKLSHFLPAIPPDAPR